MPLVLISVVTGYALLVLGAFAGQRWLIYPRRGTGTAPVLEGATLERLAGADGRTVFALYAAARDGAPTLVHWTAFDADAEDLNGNGRFDVTDGEDFDGDGVLDREPVGVAFDCHWLAEGEDPSAMSDAQLAALDWVPCTRVPGVGDTDSLETSPGAPIPATGPLAGVATAPPGVGRSWVFAWDAALDAAGNTRGMILRATPFDTQHNHGSAAYSRIVVHTEQ